MAHSKSIKIDDPAAYFTGWHYTIEKHHFETLGVTLRNFVKNKVSYSSYAIDSPPNYQFLQGYIFYNVSDSSRFLQIAAEVDLSRVEVHSGRLHDPENTILGYAVSVRDCATWLRTGELPARHKTVDVATSKGGLLAWQLVEKPTPTRPVEDQGGNHGRNSFS